MYCKNCGKALMENEACTCQSVQNPKKGLDIKALLTPREQMPMKLVSITIIILALDVLISTALHIATATSPNIERFIYFQIISFFAVVAAVFVLHMQNKSIVEKGQGEDYSFLCLILPFGGMFAAEIVSIFTSFSSMVYELKYYYAEASNMNIIVNGVIPALLRILAMAFTVYFLASLSISFEKRRVYEKKLLIENSHIVNDKIGNLPLILFIVTALISNRIASVLISILSAAMSIISMSYDSAFYTIMMWFCSTVGQILSIVLPLIVLYFACHSINKQSGYLKTGAYIFVAFLFPKYLSASFISILSNTVVFLASSATVGIGLSIVVSIFGAALLIVLSFVGLRLYEGFREKNDAKIMADCE